MNKNIYKYFNGEKDVYADPSVIDYQYAKMTELPAFKQVEEWMAAIPDKEDETDEELNRRYKLWQEACHRLDPIIRKLFSLADFNRETGEGMLHEDVIDTWYKYLLWRSELKKNTEESPTSAIPTGST